jgi:elongation factor 2
MGDLLLDPAKGSVAFGSGKDCWAFTLTKFARIYEKKFKTEYQKLMPKLWGDNFFNPKTKKFCKDSSPEDGVILKRAFA